MEDLYTLRGNNVSVDNKIKSLITAIHFNCIGNVSKVYAKGFRVDITLPYLNVNNKPIVLKGVEIVRPGTHKIKINYTPEIGDVALVFATQNYNGSGKFAQPVLPKDQCPYFDPYGDCTLKAILVQTNEDNPSAINIDIEDTNITVSCPSSLTVNCKSTAEVNIDGASTVVCKDTSSLEIDKASTIVCKDTSSLEIDKASTVHCKDTATITIDEQATITCNDKTSISCSDDVTISASNADIDVTASNINVTASQLNVNNGHLVVT